MSQLDQQVDTSEQQGTLISDETDNTDEKHLAEGGRRLAVFTRLLNRGDTFMMEVLGTVIHYLKSHVTSLRPFLYIGIISATRGILLIGAKLTVGGNPEIGMNFTNDMVELGVSAGVILALGITIKLLGKSADFEE